MPRSTRSSLSGGKALQPISNLPSTPGRQMKKLKNDLEKKETENNCLKDTIADLSKALGNLQVVTNKVDSIPQLNKNGKTDVTKKNKKNKKGISAPKPAKSAYKFFCDANKQDEKTDMRLLWRECTGKGRKPYTDLQAGDKKRFEEENVEYQKKVEEQENEEKALQVYYEKQKQEIAMEFYEAHVQAQTTVANKKKKKREPKDPDAPKRYMSNFMFFSKDKRDAIAAKNPNKSPTEIAQVLGEEWGKLNKGKGGKKGTKTYDDLAAKDKLRYEKEKATYDEIKSERDNKMEEEHEKKMEQDKLEALKMMEEIKHEECLKIQAELTKNPKEPSSAYLFYAAENREYIESSMPINTTNVEIMTELDDEWRELSEEEKLPYFALAENDRMRYQEEMESAGLTPTTSS